MKLYLWHDGGEYLEEPCRRDLNQAWFTYETFKGGEPNPWWRDDSDSLVLVHSSGEDSFEKEFPHSLVRVNKLMFPPTVLVARRGEEPTQKWWRRFNWCIYEDSLTSLDGLLVTLCGVAGGNPTYKPRL